ncbi:MAG: hypothetical protein OEZ06_06755 [Myxococcales bacterium]|nr:hypothetical protein [Myxococcales bacterium]
MLRPSRATAVARGVLPGALLLSLLWALSQGQAALAQPPRTSSLSWVRLPGAESCISTQQLAALVERRIGRRAFVSASQADISLEGRVERKDARWQVTLVLSNRHGTILGERRLQAEGDDCSVLEASLVLVIAIAIDPGATLPAVRGPGDALSAEAETMLSQLDLPEADDEELLAQLTVADPDASGAADDSEAESRSEATRERREPPGPQTAPAGAATGARAGAFRFSLGAELGLGALPSVAGGARLRLGYFGAKTLAPELRGSLTLQQSQDVGEGRILTRLWSLGAALCPRLLGEHGGHHVQLCGAAVVTALEAAGRNFAQNDEGRLLWTALALGPTGRLAFGGLWLHLGAELSLPLSLPSLHVQNAEMRPVRAHRPSGLGLQLEAGVGLALD